MNSINNTLFIGKVFFHYENLPSTNLFALEQLSKQDLIEGTVFSTFAQTEGRGQINNQWESEPQKNISLSIVLKPRFISPNQQFLLNQAISLGVYDFIRLYVNDDVSIKWSNDIYVKDKKIAGILIQNNLQGNLLQYTIVGIGINVNQTEFKSNAPNPTSINLETGKELGLWSAIEFLFKYIENRYLQLKSGQHELLRSDYHSVLYRKDQWHYFQKDNLLFEGKILKVEDDGKLCIQTPTSQEHFDFKSIKFVL